MTRSAPRSKSSRQRSPISASTGAPDERAAPLRDLIDATLAAHGESVLADRRASCRFDEIAAHLASIRSYLDAGHVAPADCIALELNNSIRAALTLLTLLHAGYSVLPLPVAGQGARGRGNEVPLPRFVRHVVSVGTDAAAVAAAFGDPASYLAVRPNPEFDMTRYELEPGVARLFVRTSGSLGTPKLSFHPHDKLRRNMLNVRARRGLTPRDRIALPTPIFHLFGLSEAFMAGFISGASIDLQERGNLLRYLQREEDFEPTVAYVTPSFCETLIRGRRSPRRYRFMVTGGDRISESTFRRSEALHGPMINSYGCTEMGSVASGTLEMDIEQRWRSVGRPYDGVTCRIVGSHEVAERGVVAGELQIRSTSGSDGYVDVDGRRLVPPESFDDGWYRTGDLAIQRHDGTLEVLGRCDLSVNRNGVLVPFADVESRLREIDGLEEAAVVAGAAGVRGRALIAFCVLSPAAGISATELRSRYADRAPAYAVPDVVRIVDALPKLPNGKIDRRSLATLAESPP